MSQVVNALTALFKLTDGGQTILGRGEPVPSNADPEQLEHYVRARAVVDESEFNPPAPEPVDEGALVSTSNVETDALRQAATEKDKEIEQLKAQIAFSKLSGESLAEWFKGKKLDDLQGVELSGDQALALHSLEDAKAASAKREPVLAYLDSVVQTA